MKRLQEQNFRGLAKAANVSLSMVGVFCVLLLSYCIYYYHWTGNRHFTSLNGLIFYYGIPAVLAGISFASLRLHTLPKISLALVLASTAVSVFAVNLFLTVSDTFFASNATLWFRASDIGEITKIAKEQGVKFDTRNKVDVIRDLRRRGIDAVPAVLPAALLMEQPDGSLKSTIRINGTEVLPHGGVSNRFTVSCNEAGKYEFYESDEHGFHNPKGIWTSGRIDAVALGDSFTQGHCVASDKNFVALIRNHYSKTLNLGMWGEGPLTMLATLTDYATWLRPRVVLWFFYEGNDIGDLRRERRSPLLMRYLTGQFSQRLVDRQYQIDQALLAFINAATSDFLSDGKERTLTEKIDATTLLMKRLVKLDSLRQRLGLVYGDSQQVNADADPVTKTLIDLLDTTLRKAKTSVDGWGGKLYFVYLPDRDRYVDPSAVYQRDEVLRTVKQMGIPLIDIHSVFRSQGDPLALFPFRRLGHYNERGHRIVAEEVLRQLSRE